MPTAAAGDPAALDLIAACDQAPGRIDAAIEAFDFRTAATAAWDIVDAANRYIEQARPWQLAKAGPGEAARLDAVLATAIGACRCLAVQLAPFIPAAAALVAAQCGPDVLPASEPLFARISTAARVGTAARISTAVG